MNRRSFLRAAGGVVAAAVVARHVRLPKAPPRLYGDGIHDDTDVLQWMIDNDRPIRDGEFLITGTLHVRPGQWMVMENCLIRSSSTPAICIHEGAREWCITNNLIQSTA